MTVTERLAQLDAVPEVISAWIKKTPASIEGAGVLYHGILSWAYLAGDVVTTHGHEIIVVNYGLAGQEAAYWLNSVPGILRPAAPDAYITGRNTPFTAAQVETFCNAQWRLTSGNAAALAIKDFRVENFDPNTVRVTGLFHDATANTRPRLTYLITLVDANGATTGANVKFEKVVE